jgi:restriction system protein
MTSFPIPTHEELMWPTLKAIREMGGSARNLEIEARVIANEKYSDEVVAVMHNARISKIRYRLAWARTWLKNSGALESRESTVWVLTELGQKCSETEMREAANKWRVRYFELKRQATKSGINGEDSGLGNSENEVDDVVGVGETWIDEMLELIKGLPPEGFERLCQRILREAGFEDVKLTPGTNDKGIDGTGTLRMGILSWDVIFQCKRYADKVGSPDMQRFKGTMAGRSEKGLFITTGTFTKEAEIEAKRDGSPPVDLFDGEALCQLMKRFNLGLEVVVKEEVIVAEEFFNQFK